MERQFEADVRAGERSLESAKFWGGLGGFFTLGLWSNSEGIAKAAEELRDARQDARALAQLKSDIGNLRAFLDAEVVENGVRVALCIFPDVALDGSQTYGPYWQTIRQTVLTRDGYACQHADGCCAGPLQIHHIRHLSRGGTNDLTNLMTLCRYHHGLQHPGNPHFTR